MNRFSVRKMNGSWTVREHVGRAATIIRHHTDTWRDAYDYADQQARKQ